MLIGRCKKVFTIFAAAVLLFVQGGTFSYQHAFAATLANGITITVLDNEGKSIVETKAVSFDEGQTAFELLQKVAEITYEEYDFGPFVTGIEGVTPSGYDYWGFFVNGVEASAGSSAYEVAHGDNILFKITGWPPKTIDVSVSVTGIIPETTLTIVEGATAYDALLQAAEKAGVTVDVSVDSQWLTYINDINHSLGESEFFSSYINSAYMEVGLVSYQMKSGDHLSLSIDSYNPTPEPEEPEDPKDPVQPEDPGDETSPEDPNYPEKVLLEQIETAIANTKVYLSNHLTGDGFEAIALYASNSSIPDNYVKDAVNKVIANNGNFRNITDLEKTILTVTAAGYDATDIAGHNLINALVNHERMTNQGNNGVIYALLALDSGNYEVSDKALWTREKLIDYLLQVQLSSGGWSLFGETASADITGISLAALSPYLEQDIVMNSIDKAVNWLSNNQTKTGGFYDTFNGGEASESVSQVIIGLTAAKMDPTAKSFTKEGGHLINHLLSFQKEDGGFSHLSSDQEANTIATVQSLLALSSYKNYINGSGSVYDFSGEDELEVIDEGIIKDHQPTESNDGSTLPNTSVQSPQIFIFGIILLLFGSGILFYRRKNEINRFN